MDSESHQVNARLELLQVEMKDQGCMLTNGLANLSGATLACIKTKLQPTTYSWPAGQVRRGMPHDEICVSIRNHKVRDVAPV